MRPWLALRHAGANFETETIQVDVEEPRTGDVLAHRRKLGSVTGLFPVLHVGDTAVHESLAICEWTNEAFRAARLWPEHALERARARAISCEMLSGFTNIRTHLSCHPFGRLKTPFPLDAATRAETERVFEIWREALARSGGPYLFGRFSIADCMYYPMRTRFRTYGVAVPPDIERYFASLDDTKAVRDLEEVGRKSPRIPTYDDYLRSHGGDPDAALAT
jgi:glutathione S-transferase